jgi:hypothetical protein
VGYFYSLNVPIKKAGAYQLRVAVRDDKSGKIGSASQFITVADIKRDGLALSGIALSSYDPQQSKTRTKAASGQSAVEATANTALTQAALRRFRNGHVLQFAYAIYNATVDKSTGQPRLTTQMKLYRDGKEIFAGKETPFDSKRQADMGRLLAEGGLQLGGLQEGEYILQIIITDPVAKNKYSTVTQAIDFEIVK